MKRKSGFYWVKRTATSDWSIAYYEQEFKGWSFDRDDMVSDDYFAAIDDVRIATPDER